MRQFISGLCFTAAMVIMLLMMPGAPLKVFFGTTEPIHPVPSTPIESLAADAPTAQELLENVTTIYAEAASYRDIGVVEIIFTDDSALGMNHASWKPFRTDFVRPDRFRFEFESFDHPTAGGFGHSHSYVIWSTPEYTRSWWTIDPEVKAFESIADSLGGPAGISSLASSRVPSLLLSDQVRGGAIRMRQPVIVGMQEVDGALCYRVEDQQSRRHDVSIMWIDAQTSLIRRVFTSGPLRGETTVSTMTIYRPELNPSIDDARFDFTPPERRRNTRRIGLFEPDAMTDVAEPTAEPVTKR